MKVLIACEFSGIVRDAFTARGHDAWSCDLLPTERPGNHIQDNVLNYLSGKCPVCNGRGFVLENFSDNHFSVCHLCDGMKVLKWDLMIAHPPCTYLTVTANKWMKPEYRHRFPNRQQQREEAVEFFMKMINAPIPYIVVENPVGIMSTRYRKPDQYIQPYQYGHIDRKKTCLWLKGLSKLVPTDIVMPHIKKNRNGKTASVHHDTALRLPQSLRWKARSRTYLGIAAAMAEQWG